jgi:transposase InsO family protein
MPQQVSGSRHESLGIERDPPRQRDRTSIPAEDGRCSAEALYRDFTGASPNRTWVMDFTYVRTCARFTYVSFIVDVVAEKIFAWHTVLSEDVNLVMTPLRMVTWQRQRERHPIEPGELIGHAAAHTGPSRSPSLSNARAATHPWEPSLVPTTTR